uniref:Uncharacterized protein n=1 Tax=Globodera rostochiensis TaxID=31243 RepID=A0A914H3N4_GLORO
MSFLGLHFFETLDPDRPMSFTVCKEKVDKNKLAKEVAFDGTKLIGTLYHGLLCGSCCLCLPLCPLVYTAGTVTLCVEGCQIAKLDKKHKSQLNELYAVLKTYTWKKKEEEETFGW